MKVKELIAALQKHDPERQVIIRGYEGGYNDVSKLLEIDIVPNPDRAWYVGEYEKAEYVKESAVEPAPAIDLYGENTKSED